MSRLYDNVWDAIEDDPAERENLKVRSALMAALTIHIQSKKMTQAQAAKKFGVTQPRIADLMRGKIDVFSIDTLVNMLGAAGLHMEMRIGKAA
jgi:predicted XRE-type DNA-binding protein